MTGKPQCVVTVHEGGILYRCPWPGVFGMEGGLRCYKHSHDGTPRQKHERIGRLVYENREELRLLTLLPIFTAAEGSASKLLATILKECEE